MGYDCWRDDGHFVAASKFKSKKVIPPGIYSCHFDSSRGELRFVPAHIVSEGLVDLPDTVSARVLKDVDRFLSQKVFNNFQRYGILYKRGILLEGLPGTGKTVIIQKVMEKLIGLGAVVFLNPNPGSLYSFITALRQIEPTRLIAVVWEDIDNQIDRGYEEEILALLDGEHRADRIVYLATTNYLKELPMRIINRPSRFAEIITVELPTAEVRKIFLEARVLEEDKKVIDIDAWVTATDGLSIDHLKELIVSVICLEVPMEKAIKRLSKMNAKDFQEE